MKKVNGQDYFKAVVLSAVVLGCNDLKAETTLCTEIVEIPTTINEQGVYCLKQDLAASLPTGAAITVATNNVTIDLNGYKLGNLAAGPSTQAAGILASNRTNVTVRNGIIRGYFRGVFFSGSIGGGHVVEDLRLDGNTHNGIRVNASPDVTVRNNSVFETGGSTVFDSAYGIWVDAPGAQLIGNNISRVFSGGSSSARGIRVVGDDAQIVSNSIRRLDAPPASFESYIFYAGQGALLDGNRIVRSEGGGQTAITINGGSLAQCSNNKAVGFAQATFQCSDGGGNAASD